MPIDAGQALDPLLFRSVMGQFATGVTVVTTALGPRLHGTTVNAFSSVSLTPPLVLICLDHRSITRHMIQESGVFCVNILSLEQQPLSDRFAGKPPEIPPDFGDVPHSIAGSGAPILAEALAWMDCKVTQRVEAGDHDVFLGEVQRAALGIERDPLMFFRSRYGQLGE